MTEKHIKTGGAAFPRPMDETSIGGNYEQDGMSLRDWFAGQALAGALACYGATNSSVSILHRDHFATCIWEIADAMLAARESQTKGGAA